MMNKVPARHGRNAVFFRLPTADVLSPEDYFRCLDSIKPLFTRADFRASSPGFYINYIRDPNGEIPGGGLRLTPLSIDLDGTLRAIEQFLQEHSDKLVCFQGLNALTGDLPPSPTDDAELPFWNCLSATTRIVLDIHGNPAVPWPGFQNLVYHYRRELLPQRVLPRSAFEALFREHSAYYRGMAQEGLDDEYWNVLLRLFPGGLGVPLHFLVNMTLTCDWAYDPSWLLLEPSPPSAI